MKSIARASASPFAPRESDASGLVVSLGVAGGRRADLPPCTATPVLSVRFVDAAVANRPEPAR